MSFLPLRRLGSPCLTGCSTNASWCFPLSWTRLWFTCDAAAPAAGAEAAAAAPQISSAEATATVFYNSQPRCSSISSRTRASFCSFFGSALPVLTAAVAASSPSAYALASPTAAAAPFPQFVAAARVVGSAATAAAASNPAVRPATAAACNSPYPLLYTPLLTPCVGSTNISSRRSWLRAAPRQPHTPAGSAAATVSFLGHTTAVDGATKRTAPVGRCLTSSADALPPTTASTSPGCCSGLLLPQQRQAAKQRPPGRVIRCSGSGMSCSRSSSRQRTSAGQSRSSQSSRRSRRGSVARAVRTVPAGRSSHCSSSSSRCRGTAAADCSDWSGAARSVRCSAKRRSRCRSFTCSSNRQSRSSSTSASRTRGRSRDGSSSRQGRTRDRGGDHIDDGLRGNSRVTQRRCRRRRSSSSSTCIARSFEPAAASARCRFLACCLFPTRGDCIVCTVERWCTTQPSRHRRGAHLPSSAPSRGYAAGSPAVRCRPFSSAGTAVSCFLLSSSSLRCRSGILQSPPQPGRRNTLSATAVSAAAMSSEVHTPMGPQVAALSSSRSSSSNAVAAETPAPAAATMPPSCSGPQVVFVLGGPGAGKGTQCELLAKRMNLVHISAGDCLREERRRPGSEHGELIERYIREGNIVPVEITLTLLLKKMLANGWNREFLIDGFPRNEDNLSGWKTFTSRENLTVKLQQIRSGNPALASQCDMALQQLLQQEKQQREMEGKAPQPHGNGDEKQQKGQEEADDINTNSGVPVSFCLYLDCPEGALEQRLLLRGMKSQRSDDNATAIRKRMVTFKEETLPIVHYFEKQHKVRRIDASAPIDDVWRAVAALFEHLPQCAAAH